jgi:CPA2 family monovalent cation:H+ antiporter-2
VDIANDLAIIVVAGLAGGLLAQRLRQPLILGYILAGIVLGPLTGGAVISGPHDIERLAEVGVALLLFALGLEFSLAELRPVRRIALIGTPIQIVIVVTVAALAMRLLGWAWTPALWFGATVSLSSTMVVLKTLQNQGRVGTLSSRVMVGMLLVQDLAVVPMLILLPKLGDLQAGLPELAWALAISIIFLVLMVVFGTRLVPWLMAAISRRNSRELFLLTVTALGLGVGYATYLVGLSFAFGAFVAGLVLSESDHNHQALSDIIPLRDIFGLLFFVSVGMLVDPAYVRGHLGLVFGMAALVAVVKGVVFAGLSRGFGYRNIVPLALGLTMFQAGEFAFVLARVGVAAGDLDPGHYSLILSVALVTMFATPLLSGLATPLYKRLRARSTIDPVFTINVEEWRMRDHVIIAGAGHVGLAAARVLRALDLQFVVIELDQWRLESCRAADVAVIYGDASHPAVLEAAGLAAARLLIITTPATETALAIARLARERRPQLHIVARADSEACLNDLYALGVYEVVQPQREAGLEITRQALLHLDVPASEIAAMMERARREAAGPRLSATSRSPAPSAPPAAGSTP